MGLAGSNPSEYVRTNRPHRWGGPYLADSPPPFGRDDGQRFSLLLVDTAAMRPLFYRARFVSALMEICKIWSSVCSPCIATIFLPSSEIIKSATDVNVRNDFVFTRMLHMKRVLINATRALDDERGLNLMATKPGRAYLKHDDAKNQISVK